jgi:putative restriction endonuclease
VKFWVGVTDNEWYRFLSELQPDEVNFWQPGGRNPFRVLNLGELFLFKLHAPLNFIVGGGLFVKHSLIPISLAWEAFGLKNGVADFAVFYKKILGFRGRNANIEHDPTIGCIILSQPFFFAREDWIPVPVDWKPNIVQGRSYDSENQLGALLWTQVQERLSRQPVIRGPQTPYVAENEPRYGAEYITRPRLGQGAFRVLVTDAYKRRCAMTGERTLPVLESAHIKPYARSGPHSVSNGLLLRSDLHKLFDLGYMTVTTDMHIEVSNRIKEEYENGRDYYALRGRSLISLPNEPMYRPSREYLEWHNENIYLP